MASSLVANRIVFYAGQLAVVRLTVVLVNRVSLIVS